ncbi:low temperature requirement protein A [Bosea sp. (in: a-proteobacteria)]|uniref:low temperature requirement protein A n=1 Tax=Bosea sp. (in: a-proteobacteria) TaxID=1871050 RepID=UPI00262C4EFB|nr:low temperature requirement protein A [Bosea sp. (in: a-proteobacteria)]MCO5090169.1 low temperature requirement protein A [Bosea sp. (in: a-proteobacteria)]
MEKARKPGALLRERVGHQHARVSYVELFFDLVFVFAITQISHTLLEHFSGLGLAQAAFLLGAVWWVWIYTSWVTNWLDPETTPVRLMLFGLMFLGLTMSSSLPDAFGDRGLVFAGAYVAMHLIRSLFTMASLKGASPANYRNFQRITIWLCISGLFWIAGGLSEGPLRFGLWLTALGIEYAGPALGFRVAGLGRSTTNDWDVEGGHFAERCALFIIIALGESVIMTGATAAKLPVTAVNLTAFVNAFVSSVAMWWIYFHIGADRGSRLIAHSDDPGRIARIAYTYLHILLVAGIILVAVGDELVIAHPLGHTETKTAIAVAAGPACYLLGNLLFKRVTAGWYPLSHLVGLGLFVMLGFCSGLLPPLGYSLSATAILILVASWEALALQPKDA